jgi:hypothetical protein
MHKKKAHICWEPFSIYYCPWYLSGALKTPNMLKRVILHHAHLVEESANIKKSNQTVQKDQIHP